MTVTANTPFREAGNTTREAFKTALKRTIARGIEPPPYKEADAIYDALFPHGLTRLGAAMAWIERRNETDPGGLDYYPRSYHNLWAVKNRDGSWMEYPSYFEAAGHWVQRVLGQTYRDLTTIREFINRYAPAFDRNDPEKYVRELVDEINALPLLDEGGTMPDPVIYDLRRDADARRFGLTPAERDRILAKRTANRNGASVQGIGLHVQAGFTSGSLRHWLGVSASSTVMVQQDGSILNVINPWDAPWTQGDVNKPDAMAADMRRRFGNDPNMWSLTIEAEDGNTHVINAKQAETIRWQIRRWQRDHPALAGTDWEGRILGHYQINSVQKPFCGTYRNEMVASLRDTPAPAPVPVFTGLPAWLPEDAFRVAFPLADPAGVVTKKVIEVVNATKQVPFFIGKVDVGNGRNLWRFEDFTLLNDGATVWREGEAA